MRTTTCIALALASAALGCASSIDDSRAGANPAIEVEAQRAALALATCEEMKGDITPFAQAAAAEANEARIQYDADNKNPNAVKYFGEYFNTELVGERLLRIVQLGRSPRVEYECQDPTVDKCKQYPTMAFYCDDEKCGHYSDSDGWTLDVCGDRFWSPEYVNGYDGGTSASQTGIMVHEMAHLSGAPEDSYLLNEDNLVNAMTMMWQSVNSQNIAESYRQYVMHNVP